MTTAIKICGLSTADTLEAAIAAGAAMVGFVFFPPSPRHLSYEAARDLGVRVAGRAQKVALSVNADDALHDAAIKALQPDFLQLHGHETPERAAELRRRTGLKIIKAIGVSVAGDLAAADRYIGAVDMILLDAKPPKDATRPGGNARAFDWTLLRGARFNLPWMLSGGLDPENVADAIRIAGAPAVDVSSGVESTPGVKDPAKIAAFCRAVRALDAAA